MNKVLRHPATNAVGISAFSIFYAVIFFGFSDLIKSQTGQSDGSMWTVWDAFLNNNGHKYLACILLTLTAVILAFLILRHKPYDEYHTAKLIKCLAASLILALAAIGLLFIMVLSDPVGIISKFSLFISIHWFAVVAADLSYLIICGNK